MHGAIYDAVNAIDGTHKSYLVRLKARSAFRETLRRRGHRAWCPRSAAPGRAPPNTGARNRALPGTRTTMARSKMP